MLRDAQNFQEYLHNLESHEDAHVDARFDLVIERMICANPGAIRLISYDNEKYTDSLLETVLSAFDLPDKLVNELVVSSERVHTGRSPDSVELLRLFNGLYAEQHSLDSNELFNAIYHATTVKNSFYYHRIIGDLRKKHKELIVPLLNSIRAARTSITLSRDYGHISGWEEQTENVAEGLVYNPLGGRLFSDIQSNTFVYSELGSDDLPLPLRRKIERMLEQASRNPGF